MGFLSTIGSYLGQREERQGFEEAQQLTRYRPPSLNTPSGRFGFDSESNSFTSTLNPQLQALYRQLLGGAQGFLGQDNVNAAPNLSTVTGAAEGLEHPLSESLFGTSQGFLDRLASGEGGYESILSQLRELAAPSEQRAREGLDTQLHSQGRLDSTTGALNRQTQQEAFSRADLERMLASFGESRNQQGFLLNSATGAAGAGAGIAGLFDSMTNSRFSRALGAYGAGQEGIDAGLRRGLGMLGGAQGIDASSLQGLLSSGQLGGLASEANATSAGFRAARGVSTGDFWRGLFQGADSEGGGDGEEGGDIWSQLMSLFGS